MKPMVDNYRNKCEFTIGFNANETSDLFLLNSLKKLRVLKSNLFNFLLEGVIGFRLGEYKSGSNEVVEPYCCRHISNGTKSLIKVGRMKNLF